MGAYRFPMHRPDGSLVTLAEVLETIDGSGLTWQLADIYGMSRPGYGLDILTLEQRVREQPGGLAYSDSEFRSLAEQLDQVIDCTLLGFEGPADSAKAGQASIELEALDSTEWALRAECDRLDPRVIARLVAS